MQKSLINVRRSSICWRGRRGTDTRRQKTRNHGYDVIVGGELFTDYPDHPRKLVTLNLKLKSTGCRTLPASFLLWCLPGSLAWKTSLRKVRTLWHCRLRSVALYPWLIVAYPLHPPENIRASLPGAGYGQFEHKVLSSLIAKSGKKRAERSERLMYEQSHRDYLRFRLSASSFTNAGC